MAAKPDSEKTPEELEAEKKARNENIKGYAMAGLKGLVFIFT